MRLPWAPKSVVTASLLEVDCVTAILNGETWALGVELTRMLGAVGLKAPAQHAE